MKLKNIVRFCLMRFFYIVRNNRKICIYFDSFSGQYSDSPRAISEAIHELNPQIELIWVSDGKNSFPGYVKQVKKGGIGSIRAMAQSRVWVTHGTGGKSSGFWKSKNTLSVATWHGDRGFKKIGYAAYKDMKDIYHHSKELPDFDDVDYLTVGSEYGVKQAIEGLGFTGKLLKFGLPRNDKLVHIDKYTNYIRFLKEKLGINHKSKILLYAPTFRDNESEQHVSIDLNRTLHSISADGNNWIILIRAHSHSKKLIYDTNEFFYDVSGIGDMADLLLISDCLITDYSSSAGDFILTGKPCVLAHFDRHLYERKSRTLWFNPDESGFLIAKNQEDLDEIMSNLSNFKHDVIDKKVLDFYGTFETGNSSISVAKEILNWINS